MFGIICLIRCYCMVSGWLGSFRNCVECTQSSIMQGPHNDIDTHHTDKPAWRSCSATCIKAQVGQTLGLISYNNSAVTTDNRQLCFVHYVKWNINFSFNQTNKNEHTRTRASTHKPSLQVPAPAVIEEADNESSCKITNQNSQIGHLHIWHN